MNGRITKTVDPSKRKKMDLTLENEDERFCFAKKHSKLDWDDVLFSKIGPLRWRLGGHIVIRAADGIDL